MKKIFALALALCLICACTVFAENNETKVTYKVSENKEYTITIPPTLELKKAESTNEATGTLSISLDAPDFNVANKKISVSITDMNNALTNANVSGESIPYNVYNGETVVDMNTEIISWNIEDTAAKTVNLSVKATVEGIIAAGDWTDTITFGVKVIDK